jgi:hypothetical protein
MPEWVGVGTAANRKRKGTYSGVAYCCGVGRIDPSKWKGGVRSAEPVVPLRWDDILEGYICSDACFCSFG